MLERVSNRESSPGRLNGSGPISIVDIGSNSVRLVVYERLSRSPTMLFNEKVLAGLGRGLAASGRLSDEAVERALAAITRFRRLSAQAGARELHVIATAAARDAENGADFIAGVESILGVKVSLLTGREEARYAALGVASGMWQPSGIVGDLGGGSLEIVTVSPDSLGEGTTLPLGALRLEEMSSGSPRRAAKIAERHLAENKKVPKADGKTLYLIGGTWRSLARLHMADRKYPMRVMHHYRIDSKAALKFCDHVLGADLDCFNGIETVSRQRRALMPYGAAVLQQVIRATKPSKLVLSALGVREGLLFDLLDPEVKAEDPLLAGAEELGFLRARSPAQTRELIPWTRELLEVLEIGETEWERRMREAACLMSDIGWRAHPDHRAEESFAKAAQADLVGIDHAGRAFLSSCLFFRHVGPDEQALAPFVRDFIDDGLIRRAKLIAMAIRIAHLICASMPGLILRTRFVRDGNGVALWLPSDLGDLDGERLQKRVAQLGRLVEMDARVVLAD
ncbi:MAG: Ppx/GppA phosphatase family protein [Pseudomonadota bacterium]